MGAADDSMAVVSEDLRVHGGDGLRVANTNAPAMMIGERAARVILGKDAAS